MTVLNVGPQAFNLRLASFLINASEIYYIVDKLKEKFAPLPSGLFSPQILPP